jgi:hypothetical protein
MGNVRLSTLVVVALSTFNATCCLAQGSGPLGMRRETISDPVLNMAAFDVMLPAKWHFAGRLLQGTSCSSVPYPVFRATSPDGLTMLERLPRMDWSWGNGPGGGANSNCLPLKREMSAREFAKYMAVMLKADYVADDPFPAEVVAASNKGFADSKAANAARYQAAGMNPPEEHVDMDRVIVQFRNGSFTMKGQIGVSIYCSTNKSRQIGSRPIIETHGCQANVRYVHAPEAQYAAMVKMLENAGAAQNQTWTRAWMDENNRQTQQNINAINQRGAESRAQLKASHEQYMQSQATRQRMHQEFMNTMQRGTNMSMNRANENMNARHTAASNVVDYALDQQTVRDPNSGQVNKVSSAYSYTWVDNSGKTSYQTNDPNANPNGALQGNWTRQQVVNGDGTSPQ